MPLDRKSHYDRLSYAVTQSNNDVLAGNTTHGDYPAVGQVYRTDTTADKTDNLCVTVILHYNIKVKVKVRVKIKVKVKVKFTPDQATKDQMGSRGYSSNLSLTSALDGVGGQCHAPAALPPGKTRYPLYRRLGEPQGRSGRVRKILSSPPGFDPWTVQAEASRYLGLPITK
jgi:hypothetical protein